MKNLFETHFWQLLYVFWLGFYLRHVLGLLFKRKVGEDETGKGKSRIRYW